MPGNALLGQHSVNPCLVETITDSVEIGKDQFSGKIWLGGV
jgi:hypothetical protein